MLNKKIIYQLYCKDNLEVSKICKQLNITEVWLYKLIDRYNIKKRRNNKDNSFLTKEIIYNAYKKEGSFKRAAKYLNINIHAFSRYFKKFNLVKNVDKKVYSICKEKLYDLYVNKKYTMTSIDKLYNLKDGITSKLLNIYKIKKRTIKENAKYKTKVTYKDRILTKDLNKITKEDILELYHNKKMYKYEVAKTLMISKFTLNKLFKKFNIKTIEVKGDRATNWKGNIKIEPDGRKRIYMPNHHRAKSKYVYNQILVAEKILKRKLKHNEVAHHIDGNPGNDNINNILIMTRKEHSKLHGRQCK